MNIGEYQQQLKDSGKDYVLNETDAGMHVVSSIDNKICIKTFGADGELI